MELWHTGSDTPYHQHDSKSVLRPRALANSSGNIQTFALDTPEGVENQNPLAQGQPSPLSVPTSELHCPIPLLHVDSHDRHAENVSRLHARRKHSAYRSRLTLDPDRPYLQHPKYLEYRSRQRYDTGADGKPVWDDKVEDAFQDALVNIKPIGRRKWSQRGRPHGRNELIAEWIYRATGEVRGRKQVSSHIQVLNGLLKGVPEWDVLITAKDDKTRGCSQGHRYDPHSIEYLDNRQNVLNVDWYRGCDANGTAGTLESTMGCVDLHHSLSRLSFEMWVSLPNQMDQALHKYTRQQSHTLMSRPMLLDDIMDWRSSFPGLRPIVDNWSLSNQCDIVLLDASFQLMTDFPPKFSKLGISLELDFLHPSGNNRMALAELTDWSCVTHLYRNGRLVKEAADDSCHVAGLGKVKPLFESKWWASTFTTLTEKKKRAEDSKNDAAVELADQSSQNFFRRLTLMQQISAGPAKTVQSHFGQAELPRHRRIAILLWRCSQAPPGSAGTTTWQKLIPPPDCNTSNVSVPASDFALHPLPMDTWADGPQITNLFESNHFCLEQHLPPYPVFSPRMEEEHCRDGFMTFKQDEISGFDTVYGPLDISTTQEQMLTHGHSLIKNDHFGLPAGELYPGLNEHGPHTTHHLFELYPWTNLEDPAESVPQPFHQYAELQQVAPHQRLSNSNVNTNQMPQLYLGTDEQHHPSPSRSQPEQRDPQPSWSPLDDEDEAVWAALIPESAMDDLGPHHSALPSTPPEQYSIPLQQPFTPPLAIGPASDQQVYEKTGQDSAQPAASNLQVYRGTLDSLLPDQDHVLVEGHHLPELHQVLSRQIQLALRATPIRGHHAKVEPDPADGGPLEVKTEQAQDWEELNERLDDDAFRTHE